MLQDYGECLRRVLLSEGGYTNDPRDPGGPTNFGITLRDARAYWKPDASAEDVRQMPRSVAEEIYKSKYWNALNGDRLPAGVDYAVFDYGVNSGIVRAGRVLRAVLGLPQSDWRVTDEVLETLARADPVKVVDTICAERLTFLQELPTWGHFGLGWTRRVASVKAFSDHLALQEEAEGGPEHPTDLPGSAKAYASDAGPILGVPAVQMAPLAPNAPQTATIDPLGTSPIEYSGTPATLVTPSETPTGGLPIGPPSGFRSRTGWAAWALGGTGGLSFLDRLNDYGSSFSMLQWNLSSLSGLWRWVYGHPAILIPIAIIAMAAFVWQDHRKYTHLLWQAQHNNKA